MHDGEGWTLEHDDKHKDRELVAAARAYLKHYELCGRLFGMDPEQNGYAAAMKSYRSKLHVPDTWPWDESYWNPQDPLRDLVKSGALIAAEIDRLLRARLKQLVRAQSEPQNDGTQRPGPPDGSLATETRKPGSLE